MRSYRYLVAIIISIACLPVLAFAKDFRVSPMLSATGGAAIVPNTEGSSVNVGLSRYDYDPNDDDKTKATWGGFLGIEFPYKDYVIIQTGAAYYQINQFPVNGVVTQGVDPHSYSSYDYNYELLPRQVLWENKFLFHWDETYFPYVSFGLGAGFIEAKQFEADVLPCDITFSPVYSDENNISFSYNVGLGVDFGLADMFRVGVGYRFTDFGQVEFGHGSINNTTTSHTIEQEHLFAHEIIAQLSLII